MSAGRFSVDVTRAEIEDLKLEYEFYSGDCQWVDDNIDHLNDVIQRAVSYQQIAVSGIELLNAIFPCVIERDDYRKWEEILDEAMLHAQNMKDNEFMMQLWVELGQNYLQYGRRKEAFEAFTMISERGEDYHVPEMELLGKIGQIRTQAIYQKGHYKDLIPEVLALAKTLDKPILHAMTHSALTLGYMLRRETVQALEHGQIAYTWWHKLNNFGQKADIAFLMAEACRLASRLEQADRFLKLAEKQNQSSPQYIRKLGVLAYHRGSVEIEQNNPAEAEKSYLVALEHFQQIEYPYLIAATHHALGVTQSKLGKFSEARSNLTTGLKIWSKLESPYDEMSITYAIGFLAFQQGNPGSALRWYNKAQKMLEQIADSPSRQQIENSLAEDKKKAQDLLNKPPAMV